MKQHGFKKLLFALFLVWTSLCIIPPAALALDETTLSGIPGAEQWQPYLEQSPVSISDFADAPLDALKKLFHGSMAAALQETLRGSTDALLFLLLAALLSFLTSETTNGELLDLIAAGGCGVLLWSKLLTLAEQLCAQMGEWRGFLLGFLPVYAGVLTMGGETAAGSAASGFFLTILCFLAQCLTAFVRPLLQCYLALSAWPAASAQITGLPLSAKVQALCCARHFIGRGSFWHFCWGCSGLQHCSWTVPRSAQASFWPGASPL